MASNLMAPPVIGEFMFRFDAPLREQLDTLMTGGQPVRILFPVSEYRVLDLGITRHDVHSATRGDLFALVDDKPFADAVLAYVDEAVAGTIVTPEGELFQVRYAGSGVHRVVQLDPNRMPDDAEPLMPRGSAGGTVAHVAVAGDQVGPVASATPETVPTGEPAPAPATADAPPTSEDATDTYIRDGSKTTLDILIVYTTQSRINNGGVAGMNAVINAATAKANLAYQNSSAPVFLRVAHTAEVTYMASGSLGTDLSRLQNGSDGYMDEVYTLRTQYDADLVSLFVDGGDAAGMAYLLNAEASGSGVYNWTFSTVVDIYADGNISFAHEVGHNLGCGHGMENGGGVFSFAGGYRFFTGQWYRTVMAYAPGVRVPYFSNPNVGYLGAPTGSATTANNVLTMTRTKKNTALLEFGAADSTVAAQLDLNQDNKPDLLVRNVHTSSVDAWVMDGFTRTSSSTIWPATTAADAAWVPMTTADFNADGKPDIVWRNTSTGRAIVWYMDGATRLSSAAIWAPVTAADTYWMPMTAGDFNADGKPDLVWRNLSTGRVIVWYMNGVTRTATATLWSPTTAADRAWVPLAAGDFNADGKPDLIWRNQSTGRVLIWFMNGAIRTGTFALLQGNNPSELAWRPMAATDFDADGQFDILWRNSDTGRVFVWHMNGTTLLSTSVIWGS